MSRPRRAGPRLVAALAVAATTLLTGVIAAQPTIAGPLRPDAGPPAAQALPTPFAFVSNLDLECFRTAPYTPPNVTIVARHINPVLANLPIETHVLGYRTQLCVPVMKNNVAPPPAVRAFVSAVDLSCYRISGQAVNFPLNLRHLNPVLGTVPPKQTTIAYPEQLCLPVIKNGVVPPAEVFNLVRYIDLKCYRVLNNARLGVNLGIRQLNPVLQNIPPATVSVNEARQLCVPIQKNNQAIPADVRAIVQHVDLEKYDTAGPPLAAPFNLTLRHINPLLTGLPQEPVQIQTREHLMLPVAKNNLIPPG